MKNENVMGEKRMEAIGIGQRETLKNVYWKNKLLDLIYRRGGRPYNKFNNLVVGGECYEFGLVFVKSTCRCKTLSSFFCGIGMSLSSAHYTCSFDVELAKKRNVA
jgi:hypothetical protein